MFRVGVGGCYRVEVGGWCRGRDEWVVGGIGLVSSLGGRLTMYGCSRSFI